MAIKKRTMKVSEKKNSALKMGLLGLLVIILKVLGIAFLIQGFVLQLATGVLYYGLLHYAIGVILVMIGWHIHKKSCSICCC